MTEIAVIAMGEMGSGVARRLVERGARVTTSLAGRSAGSAERARSAGVAGGRATASSSRRRDLPLDRPAGIRAGIAERFLPLIAEASRKPVFIDCNAIAPQTLQVIARVFGAKDLPFLDGSIIGPPPKPDGSGPQALRLRAGWAGARPAGRARPRRARRVRQARRRVRPEDGLCRHHQGIPGARHGDGARRMAKRRRRAFFGRAGGEPAAALRLARRASCRGCTKAYRWVGEMEEIATFLVPETGSSEMLSGAARLYEHVAADNRAGPDSEIIATLE